MYKIAVLGDRDSILGFGALGLDVFPCVEPQDARHTLHQLARKDYAIVYVTGAAGPADFRRHCPV